MDLLSEELVRTELAASTRDGVLGELIDVLVAGGALAEEAREGALKAVIKREERQSTGVGGGVAIPHGTCADVDEIVAALGVHRGVDFASIDDAPVQLVILLLVPPNHLQAHIRTLAGIARVLNDPELRNQLVAAPSAGALIDLLIEREEATA